MKCVAETRVYLIWIGSSELTLTLCGNGKECMWNIHNAYGTNTVKKWNGSDWHSELEEGSETVDCVRQLCFLTDAIMQYTHTIYRLFPFMLWTSGIPKCFSLIGSFVAALHISRYFLLMGQQVNIKVCYEFSTITSEAHVTSNCSWKWCCISYVYVCVSECFKGFTEDCEGLGDDASSEKLSAAKNLEMKTELIEDQLHLSSRQFISFVMRTVKKEDVHKACYTQPYKW